MVSVIIPVYNEERTIGKCLMSLGKQSYKDFEVIVIDDGSTDKTSRVLSEFSIKLLRQKHLGPAKARNLGARHSKGDILVFVDADMTFEKHFITKLVNPIGKGEVKGTFTKEEYVSNWENKLARCWNYNEGIYDKRRIPHHHPDKSPVFRAILKSEFERASGFDPIGFTDDWTLSRKLGYKAQVAKRAICYHKNPESLFEIYKQARWIGKNEFISGSLLRRVYGLFRFSFFIKFPLAIIVSFVYREPLFMIFSLVYYTGIHVSIYRSFFGESKNK